jgi:DNA-directed RNA polymerase subunit M/transcription elongation factor TFIIS
MSYIVWSRSCRKCKGQFYLEESEDGAFLVCIQCGYTEKIVDSELTTILSAIQPARKKDYTEVK